ncbi:hypothetical protein [Chelativorans alearense]|uniref:hypothetical protein n=1 Tax=Chelativorans alearense TaxID=2681495 RepID=UPI0013D388BB|nr:hypothetical protein [Chelativorans alearense]
MLNATHTETAARMKSMGFGVAMMGDRELGIPTKMGPLQDDIEEAQAAAEILARENPSKELRVYEVVLAPGWEKRYPDIAS